MPIVEIASVNAESLNLNQDDFEVAIIEEHELKSHRRNFKSILSKQKGSIVHVGNPEIKNDSRNIFYAGNIIDWELEPVELIYLPLAFPQSRSSKRSGANQVCRFRFLSNFIDDIDKLLKAALNKSPVKKAFFMTDYYFGPEKGRSESIHSITDFWKKHDQEGLIFNTLYEYSQV